jgi:hypothetical protein
MGNVIPLSETTAYAVCEPVPADGTIYYYSDDPQFEQHLAFTCRQFPGCSPERVLQIYDSFLPVPRNYRRLTEPPTLTDFKTGPISDQWCEDTLGQPYMAGFGVGCGPGMTAIPEPVFFSPFAGEEFTTLSAAAEPGLVLYNTSGTEVGTATLTFTPSNEPIFILNIHDPEISEMIHIDLTAITDWKVDGDALILVASEMAKADVTITISYSNERLYFAIEVKESPLLSKVCIDPSISVNVLLRTADIPLISAQKERTGPRLSQKEGTV